MAAAVAVASVSDSSSTSGSGSGTTSTPVTFRATSSTATTTVTTPSVTSSFSVSSNQSSYSGVTSLSVPNGALAAKSPKRQGSGETKSRSDSHEKDYSRDSNDSKDESTHSSIGTYSSAGGSSPSSPLPSRPARELTAEEKKQADVDMFSIDRWGTVRRMEHGPPPPPTKDQLKAKREREKLDSERELKWVAMVRKWDKFLRDSPEVVKRRVRKGIPDSMRALVWPTFVGGFERKKQFPALYQTLLAQESEHQDVIRRDINRTFPNHIFFREPGDKDGSTHSIGRESLYNVLKAYSLYDKEVGYCQGMGFLVGIFLMYYSEEDAFWMLHAVLRGEKHFLNGLYFQPFPLLFQMFFQLDGLIKHFMPRLWKHFKANEVECQLFATQWFITVFSYNLPFDVVLRIWDIFLLEGPKFMFRLAIYFLQRHEKALLKDDFPGIVMRLKEIHKEESLPTNIDDIFTESLKIKLSHKRLDKLAKKYQVMKFKEEQAKKAKAAAKKPPAAAAAH